MQRDKGSHSSGSLGPGWSYYVEPRSFEEELRRVDTTRKPSADTSGDVSVRSTVQGSDIDPMLTVKSVRFHVRRY
jgi:hypothetical protein